MIKPIFGIIIAIIKIMIFQIIDSKIKILKKLKIKYINKVI